MKKLMICLLFLMVLLTPCAAAQEDVGRSVLQQQLEQLDLSAIDSVETDFFSYDLEQGVKSIAAGDFEWDLRSIVRTVFSVFFKQFRLSLGIMLQLVVLAFLGAFGQRLQNSFGEDGMGSVVLYICFALAAALGLRLFYTGAESARQAMEQIVLMMNALVPILLTLLATGGNAVTAGAMHPVLLTATSVTSMLIKDVITPLVFISTALHLTNLLSKDLPMQRMANLFTTVIKWGTGVILTVFIGVIGLFGAVIPSFDSISVKTARYAVGSFVPVVGGMLSDSVDLVISSSMVLKNAVGTAGMIALLALCFAPAVRLMAQAAMFHLAAALVEPVAHERMTGLLSVFGKSMTLLFAMTVTTTVMFIIAIALVIGAGG